MSVGFPSYLVSEGGQRGKISRRGSWKKQPQVSLLLRSVSQPSNWPVAQVVLHVQGGDVEELGGAARRVGGELVPGQSYRRDLVQSSQQTIGQSGHAIIF